MEQVDIVAREGRAVEPFEPVNLGSDMVDGWQAFNRVIEVVVSDGANVVLNSDASRLAGKLKTAGYAPVPVDLAELKKGGGSVKCCIAELRP